MSDNPHFEEASVLLADKPGEYEPGQYEIEKSKALATLALAYEQRTANLIAMAQMEHRNDTGIGFDPDYNTEAIYERLGLS